uniref:head-tail adaptor protein n=1 Tax=Falsirhodobacter xinxiangensis TaxID=2530049 RepID=UPI0024825D91|nr:head-tail adaptor protein [Rhodobacter xinxiangensis]
MQFQVVTTNDDGYAEVETWSDVGSPRWAKRQDVSDSEKYHAQANISELRTRFTVRSDSLTRGVTTRDRLISEGETFHIVGIKEIGRRDWLEITASARSDQ